MRSSLLLFSARWSTAIALLVVVSGPAAAQDWDFTHDASGNTTARVAAASSLPQIIGQPQPQIVAVGDVAAFSVALANAAGATFQWRFNTADIGGATGDSYVIPSVLAGNAGLYSVVVTNGSGSVTSADAALLLDSDGDSLPDSWEIANFGNLNQTATGDADADGTNNLTEYREGTIPTSNASRKVRLTLSATGGAVSVSPAKVSYDLGETVTLTAIPTLPNGFRQWEGAVTGSQNPQPLVMSADRNVIARFNYIAVPSDAIAWWRGETDASDWINGHHGTFYTGNTATGPAVTAGKVGSAMDFDGTRHIRVNAAAAFRADRFTVEGWVYPTIKNGTAQTLFAGGSTASGGYSWAMFLFNGFMRFNLDHAGQSSSHYNGTELPLNAWSHVAVTWDGTFKGMYVNGSGAAEGVPAPVNYQSASVPVTIGADFSGGPAAPVDHFTGRLDELTFYSRALSQAEIAAIANGSDRGKATTPPVFATAAKLPEAPAGVAYTTTLLTSVGSGPVIFALAGGALPTGLTLSEAGVISGTPLTAATYSFDVMARGANGILNQRTFTLRVNKRAAPPQGIVAWWRGEPDVSGQAIDHIAARNGSFFQTSTPTTAQHITGKVGSAFFFPTPGLHARVTDNVALRPAQVTVEAWIYPTWASSAYRGIVARGATNSVDTWYLGTRNGVIDFFTEHVGANFHLLNSPAIPLYEWTHVVGTFDGSTKALYINGVRVAVAQNLGALVYVGSVPVTIGSDWENGPAAYFYGLIDEVTLYNRALTAPEVLGLAEASGSGKSLTGPFSIDLGSIVVNQPITTSLSYPTGVAPVNFSLLAGEPPPGISLLTSGAFSGTSPTSGEFSFSARATDANSAFMDLIPTVKIYRPADRPAGLVSWWRAENDMQDFFGANHGTNFGATTYPTGKVGKAFGFNGSSGVLIPDAPSLRPTSLTFEAWVNFNAYGGIHGIGTKPLGSGVYNTWALYMEGSNLRGTFSPTSTSSQVISSAFAPQIGRWYHLAYVFEAGVAQRLYIDGVRVATQTVSAPLLWDTNSMCIGRDTENSTPIYFLNGAIDEAAIYGRAATDSEIAAIYAADVAGKALPGFGDLEDLDGDQLVNFMEYGISTDLNVMNAGPEPTTLTDMYGGVHSVISLVRDPRRTDVTLTIESSGDLYDWVPIATSTGGNPFTGIAGIVGEVNGNAPRTVTIIDPYYGGSGFLRLRVSR